jgi:hypothetical protein
MPTPECRSIQSTQDYQYSRKMILPAIPTDSARVQENHRGVECLPVPVLESPVRSNNPQALEAEIVRLGNHKKAPVIAPAPVTISPRAPQTEKIAPSGYRPLHMLYQASTHAVIDGHQFQKKGGFSFYFSWHDILLFCLVGLVVAVITGSIVLIYL